MSIETGVGHRAIWISSATSFAASHRANLATGTVSILSADGHAHSLAAALVNQTLGIGRAKWTANRVLTSKTGSATFGSSARCGFSDTSRVGSRIGQETGWACALCSLIYDVTQSVWSANCFGAARVLAATFNTSFVSCTIAILVAANNAHVVEANVAKEAIIVHAAGQHTLAANAFFVHCAFGVVGASWNTTAVIASVSGTAFCITSTSNWNTNAFSFWCSSEAGRARTNSFVIDWTTLGVHTAGAIQRTRVNTLSADTRLTILAFFVGLAGRLANSAVAESIGWTIRLGFAAYWFANAADSFVSRISFETLSTNTRGLVISRKAIGIRSARVSGTDILAFRLSFFSTANG